MLKKNNLKNFANLIYFLFKIQECFTHITEVNNPELEPCIYAMWHAHQCCIHGLKNRAKTNVLISRSKDGEVIADVVRKWGFKLIRGSAGKKGAIEASMQMVNALKSGENCAMMVDGPRGPAKIAKNGAVKIARLAGVPIVPVYWYSSDFNWIKLPSWDGLRMPVFRTCLINFYGEPIYVPKDSSNEDDENIRMKLQNSLTELEKKAPEAYKKVYRFGIWRRK